MIFPCTHVLLHSGLDFFQVQSPPLNFSILVYIGIKDKVLWEGHKIWKKNLPLTSQNIWTLIIYLSISRLWLSGHPIFRSPNLCIKICTLLEMKTKIINLFLLFQVRQFCSRSIWLKLKWLLIRVKHTRSS